MSGEAWVSGLAKFFERRNEQHDIEQLKADKKTEDFREAHIKGVQLQQKDYDSDLERWNQIDHFLANDDLEQANQLYAHWTGMTGASELETSTGEKKQIKYDPEKRRAHLESQSKWWRANTERPTMSVDEIEKIAARKGVDNLGMERWLREMVGMEITEDNRGDFVGTTYKGRRQLLNRPGILPSGLRTETKDTSKYEMREVHGQLVQFHLSENGEILGSDPIVVNGVEKPIARWERVEITDQVTGRTSQYYVGYENERDSTPSIFTDEIVTSAGKRLELTERDVKSAYRYAGVMLDQTLNQSPDKEKMVDGLRRLIFGESINTEDPERTPDGIASNYYIEMTARYNEEYRGDERQAAKSALMDLWGMAMSGVFIPNKERKNESHQDVWMINQKALKVWISKVKAEPIVRGARNAAAKKASELGLSEEETVTLINEAGREAGVNATLMWAGLTGALRSPESVMADTYKEQAASVISEVYGNKDIDLLQAADILERVLTEEEIEDITEEIDAGSRSTVFPVGPAAGSYFGLNTKDRDSEK